MYILHFSLVWFLMAKVSAHNDKQGVYSGSSVNPFHFGVPNKRPW